MNLGTAGLIVGIGGVLISVVIAVWQRRPKRIVYDISANRRIITRTPYQESGALHVMYGQLQLKDPHLVVVRVTNDGKVEVRPEDWEEPFKLRTESEIIDSGIVGRSSEDLNASIVNRELHEVSCSKLLLNKDEWFDIQMLVDGSGGALNASARIAGAKLSLARPPGQTAWRFRRTSYQIAAVAGVVIITVLTIRLLDQPIAHVPTLIGKPVSQAIPDLHRANLNLGREWFVSSSIPPGDIVAQFPIPGSTTMVGAQVSLIVSEQRK